MLCILTRRQNTSQSTTFVVTELSQRASYPIPRKHFTPPDLYYGKRGVKFFRRKGNKPPREQVNKGAYFCLENSYLFLYIQTAPITPRDVRRRQIRNGVRVVEATLPSAAELSRSRRQIFESGMKFKCQNRITITYSFPKTSPFCDLKIDVVFIKFRWDKTNKRQNIFLLQVYISNSDLEAQNKTRILTKISSD